MEKLELKHINPYSPYRLKGIYNNKEFCQITGVTFNEKPNLCRVRIKYGNTIWPVSVFISSIKPILRPLSDLTKEIEHNGEKFVPMDKLELLFADDMPFEFKGNIFEKPLEYPYKIVQKLIEWHFDVFRLIEAGPAININNIQL